MRCSVEGGSVLSYPGVCACSAPAFRKERAMNIDISGRHFELSEGIKTYAREKLSVMEKFYDGIDDIHVVLEVTAGTNHARIQVRGDRLKIDARAQSHDMYAALDETMGNLEKQLRRFKDRLHSHPHRPGQEDANAAFLSAGDIWMPDSGSELTGPLVIDRIDSLPRMRTEDAMTEYELIGGHCMLFHNIETSSVNAVYRASDGSSRVVELKPLREENA